MKHVPRTLLASGTTLSTVKLCQWLGLPPATAYDQPRQRSARGLDEAMVVRDYGLQQEYITPYMPQQYGLCERFIKTFKEELCGSQRFASLEYARMKIRSWIHNHRRPHQGFNYRTPAQQHHPHPASPCKIAA